MLFRTQLSGLSLFLTGVLYVAAQDNSTYNNPMFNYTLVQHYTEVEPAGFDDINGSPATDSLDGNAPPPDTSSDVVNAGNYLITNCLSGKSGDKATSLQQNMRTYGDYINKIVGSLNSVDNKGSGSIFNTYFKAPSNVPNVKYIFQKIQKGDNVVYNSNASRQPTLTCVRDKSPNPDMRMWWDHCNDKKLVNSPIAFHIKNTGTVMLCPRYFDLRANPPSRCNTNDEVQWAQNQFGVLVHEWIHVFGDTDEGQKIIGGKTFGGGEEKYIPRLAKKLDQFDAKLNPQVGLHFALFS